MRLRDALLVVSLAAGADAWAGSEFPARANEKVVANELIVHLMPNAAAAAVISRYLPGAQIQAMRHEQLFRIRFPNGLPNGVSSRIAADVQVDFVEPNRIRHAVVSTPNDPNYASQWWLQAVQALPAWSLLPGQYLTAATAATGRVKVAVLDTGADCTHPDFINTGGTSTDSAFGGQLMFSVSQAIVPTTVANPVCTWQDDHGHGTHVTGIIAAATSNGVGVSSLGYPVQVMEFKVLDSTGSGNDVDIANAIIAAVNAGAQIVSMSLGGAGYSPSLQSAINYAWQHNTLVVAAAGNDGSNELFFPAAANHAVAVSATDSGGNLASFSNFGSAVQLAAPGVGILSTAPTRGSSQGWVNYVSLSGTSMATPFVSALAGLVAMSTPNATAQAILQRIEQTATSITAGGGWTQNFGFGIINALNAVAGSIRPAVNGAITGQIITTVGSPVNGAQITINGQTVTTDTTGLYRFATLPAGTYPVAVSASGFAPQSLSAAIAPGADTSFTVTMGVTPGKFTGTVTDQGAGVAGAIVQALAGGLIKGVAVADQTGQFSLWVPGGTYDVRASAIGRNTTTVSALFVGTGGTTSANLTLLRMGTILGTVRDPSLAPVASAQVLVTGGTFSAAAATDGNGNYSLIGVPTGNAYTATATATGFLPSTQNGISVSANVATNVNFAMSSSAAATPTFNPPAGAYTSGQSVAISTTTAGASIHYTTDGSTPSASAGLAYTGPIPVSSSLTLKAVAYKIGLADSPVATAAYTITISSGGPAWYNTAWANRKAVTLDHTKVAGAGALANFPMLFSVTDPNLKSIANGGNVGKADGTDLVFTAADGTTKLDHQIEAYDGVTGQVSAWVRLPVLSPATDTVVYVYYGNAAAADQQNKTAVWDSNYKLVWHLADGTTLNGADSTSNGNNGAVYGPAGAGKIGGGAAGDVEGVSGTVPGGDQTRTLECWFKITGNFGADQVACGMGYNSGTGTIFALMYRAGSSTLSLDALGMARSFPWTPDSNWHHLAAAYTSGLGLQNSALYLDGVQQTTTGSTGTLATQFYTYVDVRHSPAYAADLSGVADEFRISNIARPAAWIATGYNNQNSPLTFFSVGGQETSGGQAQAAIPTFNPPAGAYSSAQSVTISTATAGASIHYTIDGSTPSASAGLAYSGPIPVISSLTLKAVAYKTGMADSAVSTASYTINGTGGGPAWYNLSWTNRKAITVDHTKVAGGGNLINFPMLFSMTDVNLKTIANGGSMGKADGTDLLFTAADGTTKLDHELESYDAATGQVIAWVRLPVLSPTVDTVVYAYYGNAAAADQQNKTAVWDSNYKLVWHLPNGTTLSGADSTGYGNNGAVYGPAGPGKISGGAAGIVEGLSGTVPGGDQTRTLECWFKITGNSSSDQVLCGMGYNSGTGTIFALMYRAAGSTISLDAMGMARSFAWTYDSNWHHLAATYTSGSGLQNAAVYLDGVQQTTAGATGALATQFYTYVDVGHSPAYAADLTGTVDEFRISSIARPAAWLLTEYNNQNSPNTFFSEGRQE